MPGKSVNNWPWLRDLDLIEEQEYIPELSTTTHTHIHTQRVDTLAPTLHPPPTPSPTFRRNRMENQPWIDFRNWLSEAESTLLNRLIRPSTHTSPLKKSVIKLKLTHRMDKLKLTTHEPRIYLRVFPVSQDGKKQLIRKKQYHCPHKNDIIAQWLFWYTPQCITFRQKTKALVILL